MTRTTDPSTQTGGCQCGALRFRATKLRADAHVCYCRMCQKAGGNLFLAFVGVEEADFAWTRGTPGTFSSSPDVARGFCPACGTPLSYRHAESSYLCLTIGSFDRPETIPLAFQLGKAGRLPQVDQLAVVPDHGPIETTAPDFADAVKTSQRQHPDHDTDSWPPGGR